MLLSLMSSGIVPTIEGVNQQQGDSNSMSANSQAQAQAQANALRSQQQQQQQQQQQGGQHLDANSIAAAMLQQQQMGGGMSADQQHGLNVANEIKRLQQLHSMNAAGAQGNGLIMQGGQRPDASILQSMIDQKVQSTRFENPLAQSMGGMNPMLQPAFLQDARLFMTNQFQQQQQQQQQQRSPEIPLPSPHSLFHRDGSRRMRGGVIEPFPEKLHRLLMEVEAAGRSDVISFVASGRAFCIHKPDKFFKEIVPLYFRQSRLSSFKRQLNLYGFELINTGPARGGYYHELFVKERAELCRRMRRVAVKVSTKQSSEVEKTTPKELEVPSKDAEGQEEGGTAVPAV